MPVMRKAATILSFILLSTMAIFAAKNDNVTIDAGRSKVAKPSGITVTFVSVEEDSRCPEGSDCIWAGNAKVKIMLKKGKKAAVTVDLDSTKGNTEVYFQGYDIKFVDLKQHKTMSKTAVRNMQLTVSITKHK